MLFLEQEKNTQNLMWTEQKQKPNEERKTEKEKSKKRKYLVQALELEEMGKFTCFNLTECKLFSSQFLSVGFVFNRSLSDWIFVFSFSLLFISFHFASHSFTFYRLLFIHTNVYGIHHVCFNDFPMNLTAANGTAHKSNDINDEQIYKEKRAKEKYDVDRQNIK